MRVRTLVIIIVIIAAGYFAYDKYLHGPTSIEQAKENLTAEQLFKMGHKAFESSQYNEMRNYYGQARAKEPNNKEAEQALYYEGLAFENEQRWKDALTAFASYLQKYPNGEYAGKAVKHKLQAETRSGSK